MTSKVFKYKKVTYTVESMGGGVYKVTAQYTRKSLCTVSASATHYSNIDSKDITSLKDAYKYYHNLFLKHQ